MATIAARLDGLEAIRHYVETGTRPTFAHLCISGLRGACATPSMWFGARHGPRANRSAAHRAGIVEWREIPRRVILGIRTGRGSPVPIARVLVSSATRSRVFDRGAESARSLAGRASYGGRRRGRRRWPRLRDGHARRPRPHCSHGVSVPRGLARPCSSMARTEGRDGVSSFLLEARLARPRRQIGDRPHARDGASARRRGLSPSRRACDRKSRRCLRPQHRVFTVGLATCWFELRSDVRALARRPRRRQRTIVRCDVTRVL
jgi:hypothetical protein